MMGWFTARSMIERALMVTLLAVLVIGGIWWGVSSWRSSVTAKVDAKVNAGHIDAVTKSGADAVETLGNRTTTETADEQKVKAAQDEINRANSTHSVVNAGLDGLRDLRRQK